MRDVPIAVTSVWAVGTRISPDIDHAKKRIAFASEAGIGNPHQAPAFWSTTDVEPPVGVRSGVCDGGGHAATTRCEE